MDINKDTKLAIIKRNIAIFKNTLYEYKILAKVNKNVEDEKGLENIKKQMTQLEKKLDEMNKIYKEVEKEEEKNV